MIIGNRFTKFLSLGLVLLVMAIIFWFSSKDASTSDTQSEGIVQTVAEVLEIPKTEENLLSLSFTVRTLAHFLEFTALGFLVFLFLCHFDNKTHQKFLLSLLWGVVYALSDEAHQLLSPGRTFQLVDLGVDTLGVMLGVLISFISVIIIRSTLKKRTP